MSYPTLFLNPDHFHDVMISSCKYIHVWFRFQLTLSFKARESKISTLQSLKSYAKRNPIDVSFLQIEKNSANC